MPVSEERFQEVADMLNDRYSTRITGAMVKQYVKEPKLLAEIHVGSYDDTYPREWLLEVISEGVTGMTWPINGDSNAYKREFYQKADELGLIVMADWISEYMEKTA